MPAPIYISRSATAVIAAIVSLLLIDPRSHAQCSCGPLPQPGPGEAVVTAGTTAEVLSAVAAASGKTTIFLNDGVYRVTSNELFNIGKPDITIRSLSGNRDDVVIEGEGMDAAGTGHGIYINADNITIADLTVREVQNHGIFVNPGADNCLVHNVRIVDCGEQLFKASGYPELPPKNNGIIECCTFEYTTTLDDGDDGWYTNGIDLLNSHDWIIRDNIIRNIKHNPAITSQLAGPAILAWGGSSGTIVERNRIIACDFGISFGNAGQNIVSHSGGVIRNNFVLGYEDSDFGIGLIRAPGAIVVHNTVFSPGGWPYSIEARFAESDGGYISNNFTDEPVLPDRDGAAYNVMTNLTTAVASDFANAATGDLHLASGTSPAVNAGSQAPERTTDIDCQPVVNAPDIGADEYYTETSVHPVLPEQLYVEVYPNPACEAVTVAAEGEFHLQVFNEQGAVILERRNVRGSATLNLENLTAGVYVIHVISNTTDAAQLLFIQ